jgi:hypothetical protein
MGNKVKAIPPSLEMKKNNTFHQSLLGAQKHPKITHVVSPYLCDHRGFVAVGLPT